MIAEVRLMGLDRNTEGLPILFGVFSVLGYLCR